jgi:hypothetical protein
LLLFHLPKAIKSKLKTVLSSFKGLNPLKKSTNQTNELFLPAKVKTSLSKLWIQKENLILGYFFQKIFWICFMIPYISSSGYGLNSKLNSHKFSRLKFISMYLISSTNFSFPKRLGVPPQKYKVFNSVFFNISP